MPRHSKQPEILKALWDMGEPSSAELARIFHRQTLYPHLKQLCEEGFVKWELIPRKKGQRGRQSKIYRLNAEPLWSYPTKWLNGEWFLGMRIQEGQRARRIGDLARQSHVRLSGQEKKDYEEKKRQQKNPPPVPDPRILEERRRARAEIIRRALESCEA